MKYLAGGSLGSCEGLGFRVLGFTVGLIKGPAYNPSRNQGVVAISGVKALGFTWGFGGLLVGSEGLWGVGGARNLRVWDLVLLFILNIASTRTHEFTNTAT